MEISGEKDLLRFIALAFPLSRIDQRNQKRRAMAMEQTPNG
jgi:hypothetical protein